MADLLKPVWSRSGLITLAIAVPLIPLMDHFGKFANAKTAMVCAMMVSLVIQSRWELHRHVWFWAAVFLHIAIQVPLVWFLPGPTHWIQAAAYIPIALGSFYLGQVLISGGDYFFSDDPIQLN